MSDANAKLKADYTARKAQLEAERDAFMQAANGRIAEYKRQLDEYVAQANGTLAAKTAHLAEIDNFLAWVDAREAEEAAKQVAPDISGDMPAA